MAQTCIAGLKGNMPSCCLRAATHIANMASHALADYQAHRTADLSLCSTLAKHATVFVFDYIAYIGHGNNTQLYCVAAAI